MNKVTIIGLVLLIGIAGFLFLRARDQFPLPHGETALFNTEHATTTPTTPNTATTPAPTAVTPSTTIVRPPSSRTLFVTDGTTHSIPLDEILSGGPGKDGIPSIDSPHFLSFAEANKFLRDDDPGIGLTLSGESRFYPYRILVWHEIVNDTIQGKPILVTYCPLCATGVVFDRRVNGGAREFGVSGLLWQSNLLMYDRADSVDKESLWSQVLGEAVVGPQTGNRLEIIPSDIMRWGDWKKQHPDTTALSTRTGTVRNYGSDPYGDYYTSESVSFGATFRDTRLHPKALVHGIEIKGKYKAYADDALQKRAEPWVDRVDGTEITVSRSATGEVRFSVGGTPLSSIPGFWFSWLAVHPDTELFQ